MSAIKKALESGSFKAGKSWFHGMKVRVSRQETPRGEKGLILDENTSTIVSEYYLHYLTKIISEKLAGFKKKSYLCIVNPERHAGGGDPMQIAAKESNTTKNRKEKRLWQEVKFLW